MDFIDIFDADSAYLLWALVGFVIGIVTYFFYLKNLSDLLTAIRPPHRALAPKTVWLILLNSLGGLLRIPAYYFGYDYPVIVTGINIINYMIAIFVVIWHFRVVRGIAVSIEAEYDSRSIPIEHRPTAQTGMFMAVSAALMLLGQVPYVGMIGKLAVYVYVIAFIVYWVRTAKFKKEIQAMTEYQDEESLIFKDLV